MKHPLHRLSKKTRNVISGFLVGAAALAAIAYFLELPGQLLLKHFLTSLVFVLLIMILAVIAIVVVKLIGAGIRRLTERQSGNNREDHM